MVFLPQNPEAATLVRDVFARAANQLKIQVLGWRQVPVKPEVLGPEARKHQPHIEQVVLLANQLEGAALERQLYLLRRQVSNQLAQQSSARSPEVVQVLQEVYVCSLSNQTVVYKGMVRSAVLGMFYQDLQDEDYISPFAVYHRRFSTNTLPRWPLAHPMRLVGHNGEINTLIGNINWMKAREADLAQPVWGDRLQDLKPTVNADNSDSANLDNVMELLVHSGRSPLEALMMMVPEAYMNQPDLINYPEIVDFYEYYSGIQEPWDGPALIVFSDGKQLGQPSIATACVRPATSSLKAAILLFLRKQALSTLPPKRFLKKAAWGQGR